MTFVVNMDLLYAGLVFEGKITQCGDCENNMKRQVEVSVIVPVYNMEMYLGRCLDSLISQTLRSIEIIIVNDGSTDNSQLVINEYSLMYPEKIRSFETVNGGLSKARNFGVERATGEYLGFVDSDDYVDVNMFECLYKEAKKSNAEIVCSPVSFVYAGSISKEYLYDAEVFGKSVNESPKILEYSKSYAWNKLYCHEFWIENKCIFPEGMWFEDTATIYPALLKAKKVACVNYPFYFYDKTREDAITKTISSKVFDIIKACSILVDTAKQLAVSDDVMEMIHFLCSKHIYIRIKMLRACAERKMISSFIHEALKFLNQNIPDWRKCHYFNKRKLLNKIFLTHEGSLLLYSLSPVSLKLGIFKIHKKRLKNRKTLKSKLNKRIVTNRDKIHERKENEDKLHILSGLDAIFLDNGIQYFYDDPTVQFLDDYEMNCDSFSMPININIIYDVETNHIVPFILENFGIKQNKVKYHDGRVEMETYSYKRFPVNLNYIYSHKDSLDNNVSLTNQNLSIERKELCNILINVGEKEIIDRRNAGLEIEEQADDESLESLVANNNLLNFTKKIRYKNYEHENELVADEITIIHELQEVLLAILKETVRVCELLDLQYYLGEGTLLGAIRHSGFIPWDDDVDILMPREDYEKFLALAPSHIGDKYLVQHWTTTKPYFSIFTKVRYLGESKFYQKQLVHITKNNGPYIDIFPLDTVPQSISKAQIKQKARLRFLQLALSYSTEVAYPPLKRYHMKMYGKLISYNHLIDKITKQYTKYNKSDNEYYVNLASWYGVDKETFPISFFGEGRKVPFEDTELIVPDFSEKILSIIYGDYLKLPPIRKRRNNHGFAIKKEY